VLALDESLEWRRDQPFAARLLPGIQSVVFLFPGEDRDTGCILTSAELAREAETRLAALTAAEDFEGRIGISNHNTESAVSLPALPSLEAAFPERYQSLWRSHLGRYFIFYASALLLLGAGAGLFFTYRAVAREMEVSRMKTEFVSSVSHEFRTPLSAIEALLERLGARGTDARGTDDAIFMTANDMRISAGKNFLLHPDKQTRNLILAIGPFFHGTGNQHRLKP